MRKNFGAKPWTYPQPVFILATYNEDGTPDAMNAAWGGISEDKELSMCISEGHKDVYKRQELHDPAVSGWVVLVPSDGEPLAVEGAQFLACLALRGQPGLDGNLQPLLDPPAQVRPLPVSYTHLNKMSLLMDHTDHPGDVADPWYTGDFEATWQDVLAGCQGLLKELTKE